MIKNLKTLRFVFCMLIFAFHFTGMLHTSAIFTYGGDAGVSFFFILSGFVLCIGYGRKIDAGTLHWHQFLSSRLHKLYPLHLAALLISMALALHAGEAFQPLNFLAQLFMLQSWGLSENCILYGNAVSWFLGPLFLCYVLFPWLYSTIAGKSKEWSKIVFALYIVMYTGIKYFSDEDIDNYLYAFPPLRIMDFAVGILAYRSYRSGSNGLPHERISQLTTCQATFVELLVVALCFATYLLYPQLPSWIRFSALYWLPFAVAIRYFALADNSRGCISRLFRQPLFQWLGGISFEIYMLHLIAINISCAIYGRIFGYDNINMVALFLLSFAVVLMLSATAKRGEILLHKKEKDETIRYRNNTTAQTR